MKPAQYTLYSNRDLINLIVPLVLETTLFVTVGMADGMMVAYLGEASISAVSMVNLFNAFLQNIFIAISVGGIVTASQSLGRKDRTAACRIAGQTIFVEVIGATAIAILVLLFRRRLLNLIFGALEPEVMEKCVTYLTITTLANPFIGLVSACNSMFRTQNKSGISLMNSVWTNIINIGGNAILIFVFKLDVAGAAYATLASRMITSIIAFYRLTSPKYEIFFNIHEKFQLSFSIIKKILYIGIPTSIENSMFTFGRVLTASLVARYGTKETAAFAVASHIDSFALLVGLGMCTSTMAVIGRCVGAGIEAQLKYYLRKMMLWAHIGHAGNCVLVLSIAPFLLSLYSKLNPETIHLVWILLFIHIGFGIIMWPASFTFPCALRALNDVKFTMCASLSSMFLIRLGLSYVFAPMVHSGVLAVWIAMICDWVVRISLFYGRYFSGGWRKHAKLKPADDMAKP